MRFPGPIAFPQETCDTHLGNQYECKDRSLAGQKQLASEVNQWAQATGIVARFIALKGAKA
jgi:hypothetical protein